MAKVKIGHARHDENGKITGGKAGDQTGNEVCISDWYKHSKKWIVVRALDSDVAEGIAKTCEDGCANNKIGYDQNQNQSLFKEAQKVGFDLSKITVPCETDCARFARVCCFGAGLKPADFYTATEVDALMATGAFEKLTASKFINQPDHLRRGDILVTQSKGHTAIVLTNGSKVATIPSEPAQTGRPTLKVSSVGPDVKTAQYLLIAKGYKLPKYGADGDFGKETKAAVMAFQKDKGLTVDGIIGPATWAALLSVDSVKGKVVEVYKGDYHMRPAPKSSKSLGVAKKGSKWPYLDITSPEGWYKVDFNGEEAYISGIGSKVV